jgi:hypothetical protein
MGDDPGDYVIDVAPYLTFNGRPNAHLKSLSPDYPADGRFGAFGTHIDPKPYLGKKLRFSAAVLGSAIKGWGGLWMRVDGPNGCTLGFDNMSDRAITGDTSWNRYEVVLDVDPRAVDIYFGALLVGGGEIWAGDDALEVVTDAPYELDPNAWLVAGSASQDFRIGTDTSVERCSRPSGHIGARVAKPAGFGALMENVAADEYRGKRVRMSGMVKASNVDHAGLWMRVDTRKGDVLAFDNMDARPIRGTSDWTPYQVVLDVPKNAASIFFGMLSDGAGDAWLDGLKFEVVDRSVPTTN